MEGLRIAKTLLNSLLHVSTKDDVAVRARPRDHVCLVVCAVTHHVGSDMRGLNQHHLASGRVALRVLDTRKRLRAESCAVEDDLGGWARVRRLDAGKPFAHKPHTVLIPKSAL